MRPVLPALAAAALLALGLSACSGASTSGTATTKGCPEAKSGSTSEKVKVTGSTKSEPKVKFDGKLAAKTTERTVVSGGSGSAVEDGTSIKISYAAYDGDSGKKLGASGYGSEASQSVTVDSKQLPAGIFKALACTTIGSRIVAVVPPKDQGASATSGSTKDIVFVFDVRSEVKPLKPSAWTTDVPEVDLAASPPVVTIPDAKPSTKLEEKVLKQGTGDTVKSGDTVTLDYQGTVWETKKIFDQSYGKTPASFPTTGVIPGFGAALVGQKVGSTVLVTIPPEDGYGATKSTQNELAGYTLVFLVQIQKTAAAAG